MTCLISGQSTPIPNALDENRILRVDVEVVNAEIIFSFISVVEALVYMSTIDENREDSVSRAEK